MLPRPISLPLKPLQWLQSSLLSLWLLPKFSQYYLTLWLPQRRSRLRKRPSPIFLLKMSEKLSGIPSIQR
jgi:hypothetical protein